MDVGVSGFVRCPKTTTILTERSWRDTKRAKVVKGHFTKAEDQLLRGAIQRYCDEEGLPWHQGLRRLINPEQIEKTKERHKVSPWIRIAACLPDRHIESIIQHVGAAVYEWPKKGHWNEQDSWRLLILRAKHGPKWKLIGYQLGRYWRSCADHYRNLRERDRVEELLEKAVAAGDDDPAYYENKVDIMPVGETQAHEACITRHRLYPPPLFAYRRRWRRYTKQEDAALLQILQTLCGIPFPLRMIPWTSVCVHFREVCPDHKRSSKSLMLRYLWYLLPQSNQFERYYASLRRNVVRFMVKLIKINPEVHWTEINWGACLPHWSASRCRLFAQKLIMRAVPFDLQHRVFRGKGWKVVATQMYNLVECELFETEDEKQVNEYIEILKSKNGVSESNCALPLEAREEQMRNYTRKFLRDADARKIATKEQAEHESAAQSGATGMEYLQKRMLQALGLEGDEDLAAISDEVPAASDTVAETADKMSDDMSDF
eukprot:Blabericola_migrator_1__2973@NODE_185_length_11802_cov_66_327567_g160_i0_p4_GENE_NODE_185_length_11802_cov_66_327567_g160_i0NODE_185_length_11802_cov_66_327567_g160_i0_p4_ORF_typecomplete_len488_score58_55Myb_DNAbind_6/PF13921_6/24Myb_DNAbind_6/PF13921_6/1_5Myb_DNAbind_6/PF13921_6/0_0033Myb_DNAbind_6/PF13921_6/0_45Myb_DNAbind_6/PF13921_6/3_5e03Myb_DNAbind_6/PF13921_6/1e04Myb_DNAbinding/PF00249_31/0_0078Myb_DNAbinding/PF00249_31/0_0081Myb_DNAbinding/PF00249_31/13Myb_DNAbinding/PF00249_31/1_7e02My